MPKIIEIKARCDDHGPIRQFLQENEADFRGTDHQVDTYFLVPQGRLKLRAGNIENTLIHYDRGDQADPKLSQVTLYRCPPQTTLIDVLTNALGVKVVVDKLREIYFIENVKFHLDRVQQLGSFVEIEAIDDTETIDESELLVQCHKYMDHFGIQDEDLIAVSYSDLLMEVHSPDPKT